MAKRIDLLIVIPLIEECRVFREKCDVGAGIEVEAEYLYPVKLPGLDTGAFVLPVGEMGSIKAGNAVQNILSHRKPRRIVLLGIAGALKDVKVGDVVVADHIHDFLDSSKVVDKDGRISFQYSGSDWVPDFALINPIRKFEFNFPQNFQEWRAQAHQFYEANHFSEKMMSYIRDQPNLEVGDIATGPTVVASEAYKVELLGNNRKFLAVEMEAGGIAEAAYRRKNKIPFLVIRGISDTSGEGVDKEVLDAIGEGVYRKYAMVNAINILHQLMRAGILLPLTKRPPGIERLQIICHPQDHTWVMKLICSRMEKMLIEFSVTEDGNLQKLNLELADKNGIIFVLSSHYHSTDLKNFAKNLGDGSDLVKNRRRAAILLKEDLDLPSPLRALHRARILQVKDLAGALKGIYARLSTPLLVYHSENPFIQAIIEELQMGKKEYEKKKPAAEGDLNIFAVMYMSAQIDSLSRLSERLDALEAKLPRASFQNMALIENIKDFLDDTKHEVGELEALVEIGLQALPGDHLGIECKFQARFIQNKITRSIKPTLIRNIGQSIPLNSLRGDLTDLSTALRDLTNSTTEIHHLVSEAVVPN